MQHYNLYKELGLDPTKSSEALAQDIDTLAAIIDPADEKRRRDVELGRAILTDQGRRRLYDGRLNDPNSEAITVERLASLAGMQVTQPQPRPQSQTRSQAPVQEGWGQSSYSQTVTYVVEPVPEPSGNVVTDFKRSPLPVRILVGLAVATTVIIFLLILFSSVDVFSSKTSNRGGFLGELFGTVSVYELIGMHMLTCLPLFCFSLYMIMSAAVMMRPKNLYGYLVLQSVNALLIVMYLPLWALPSKWFAVGFYVISIGMVVLETLPETRAWVKGFSRTKQH